MMTRLRAWGLLLVVSLCAATAWAGTIDTGFLEQPWPKQWVHTYEIGKSQVRWREKASRTEGIFAGAEFVAPTTLQKTWDLANDYTDVGRKTPGVTAVRFLEQTPIRQVIQIDVKILWKTLTLTFEVEQDPPNAIRFRLVNREIGEYLGVSSMRAEGEHTRMELATWLRPAVQVPSGLILMAERAVLLKGIHNFLRTSERAARPSPT